MEDHNIWALVWTLPLTGCVFGIVTWAFIHQASGAPGWGRKHGAATGPGVLSTSGPGCSLKKQAVARSRDRCALREGVRELVRTGKDEEGWHVCAAEVGIAGGCMGGPNLWRCDTDRRGPHSWSTGT